MVQYRCQAELLFIVPPEAFDPIPKVESAIIYLHPLVERIGGNVDIQALGQVVTQAFSQRRKTIANTLKNLVGHDILLAAGIDLEQRPETITVIQYVEITRRWLESSKD
jgi:16S rRNA (adenine1518-N6/adenine1519-N6)-dimethyltransferase